MEEVKGRMTVLADNIVVDRVDSWGEHGFSVYIETARGNYLLDTGRGGTIVHNAVGYKKDLGALNKIILSHGHGDHTGGLPEVLRFHKEIDVLAHPDVFLNRFRKTESGEERYGGLPYTRGHLERIGAKFVLNEEFVGIEEGIYLTGAIPRETDYEVGDMGNRYCIRDGTVVPEIVLDDQSIIIKTQRGILLVLGCAHAGIINIVNHAIKMTGVEDFYAIVGGTHLGFSGDVQLENTIKALKAYRIEHFSPGHCTGIEVAVRLEREFPATFHFCHVGKVLEF